MTDPGKMEEEQGRTHRRLFIAAAAAALLLSVFLHFWRLGEIPDGFFFDESSIGYNAWSVALTGRDEYGILFPVLFRAFDNYLDPVIIYSAVPLLLLLGPCELAVRIPGGVFCILASAAFYFLLRFYVRDRWPCLLGAFVFSILPWIFPLSRVGFSEYMPMLLAANLGCLFLLKSVYERSIIWACTSALAWALTIYSHNCGKPVAAVVMLCFIFSFNVHLLKRVRQMAWLSAVLALALVPLALTYIGNSAALTSRFGEVGLWSSSAGATDFISGLAQRYLEYFSPSFLFFSGDPELRHNIGISGELFMFMAPLVIAGLAETCMTLRKKPHYRFIMLCLLTYPAVAVLTKDHYHSTRCMNGAPFWCLLAVIGLKAIWRWRARFGLLKAAFAIFAALAVLETAQYMAFYSSPYAKLSRASFDAPLIEALKFSSKNIKNGEALYVSSSTFYLPVDARFKPFFYSHLIFFMKVNPSDYQKEGLPSRRIRPFLGKVGTEGLLIRMNSKVVLLEDGTSAAVPNTEEIPDGSVLLNRIPLKEGSDRFFEVYRVAP